MKILSTLVLGPAPLLFWICPPPKKKKIGRKDNNIFYVFVKKKIGNKPTPNWQWLSALGIERDLKCMMWETKKCGVMSILILIYIANFTGLNQGIEISGR